MSQTAFEVHVADNPFSLEQSLWSEYLSVLNPIAVQATSYYRSQIYTEKTGINPLVKAASPLLSLLGKVNAQQLRFDEEFIIYLEHEFKALISESLQLNFDKDLVQMAYCMLQAAFLEAEEQTEEDVIEVKAATAHIDFFSLFEQKHESLPLDLLELGYLLISLGYKGKYRNLPDGKLQLDTLSKRLYEYIRLQRGEYSKTLALPNPEALPFKPAVASFSLRSIFIVTFSVLAILYMSFNYVLELSAAPTYQELQRIQQVLTGSHEQFFTSLLS
jgi:type VI protein secretion system component VasF